MKRRAALWLAAPALLAGGCAGLVPMEPADRINGRLAVLVDAGPDGPARGVSGSFELRGNALRGQLDLVSPIGVTIARARWEPGRAELAASDAPIMFDSLDALSLHAFGERLPLAALFDWLRGRPWPAAAARPSPDGSGFEQLGWTIDTRGLADGRVLARRPAAPAVTLRAQVESMP